MTGSDDDNPALGRDWFPSPWGAEDQRGNANLLGPHKVLEALALVRFGETIPLGFPTPRACRSRRAGPSR